MISCIKVVAPAYPALPLSSLYTGCSSSAEDDTAARAARSGSASASVITSSVRSTDTADASPSRAVPGDVKRVARAFTTAYAEHDARDGHDRSHADAGARAAGFGAATPAHRDDHQPGPLPAHRAAHPGHGRDHHRPRAALREGVHLPLLGVRRRPARRQRDRDGRHRAGKSALTKTYAARQIRLGRKVVVLDTKEQKEREKGEWAALGRSLTGTAPVRFAPGDGPNSSCINPMDPAIAGKRQIELVRTIVELGLGRALDEFAGSALRLAIRRAHERAATDGRTPVLADVATALRSPNEADAAAKKRSGEEFLSDRLEASYVLDRLCGTDQDATGDLIGTLDGPTSLSIDLDSDTWPTRPESIWPASPGRWRPFGIVVPRTGGACRGCPAWPAGRALSRATRPPPLPTGAIVQHCSAAGSVR